MSVKKGSGLSAPASGVSPCLPHSACVERPDDNFLSWESIKDTLVGGHLIGVGRLGGAAQETEFGAQQAHALGVRSGSYLGIGGTANIGQQGQQCSVR